MQGNPLVIVTLLCDFVLPVMMVMGGALFLRDAPKHVNGWCGYRTSLSVRTQETWRFAHRYFGRFWLIFGGIELCLTIALVVGALLSEAAEALEAWSLLGIVVQLVGLVIPIIPTEKALKVQFTPYGCPLTPMAKRLSAAHWEQTEKAPAEAAETLPAAPAEAQPQAAAHKAKAAARPLAAVSAAPEEEPPDYGPEAGE
ncbi:MAG: SdpI family protein [Faecalibacterium sp.]|jgi:hypothetical protein|nr:SdpI family protein [Faecalibacterium sp.]